MAYSQCFNRSFYKRSLCDTREILSYSCMPVLDFDAVNHEWFTDSLKTEYIMTLMLVCCCGRKISKQSCSPEMAILCGNILYLLLTVKITIILQRVNFTKNFFSPPVVMVTASYYL